MNPMLPILIEYVATGAAWGITWLGCFGLVRPSLGNVPLMKLVGLIFAIAGSITAALLLYNLYVQYSGGSPDEQAQIKELYKGKSVLLHGGILLIKISPIFMLYKGFRNSKLVAAIVGVCYVLLPYYGWILSKVLEISS